MFESLFDPATTQLEAVRDTGVQALWEKGIEGEGITVAVLDSGTRPGLLGDRLESAEDLTGEGNPNDTMGHGTDMAGFVLGYARKSRIASIKVVDCNGLVSREMLIRALEHCMTRYPEIRIVNISLGIRRRFWWWRWCTLEKPCSLCQKTNDAVDAGLIVVAAAGNLGREGFDTLTCPAMAAKAQCIAAMGKPPQCPLPRFLERFLPRLYDTMGPGQSGTSISAARVSGGMALLLSANPDLTLDEITEPVDITATRIQGPPEAVGVGQAHYYRAYKLLAHKRAGRLFDPDLAIKHFEDGLAYRDASNNEHARRELEKAIALAPTSFTFHDALGVECLQVDDLDRAKEYFQESIRLNWDGALAHNNLGAVLEKMGRLDQAIKHYRISAELDPALQEAADNVRRLSWRGRIITLSPDSGASH